MAFARTAPLRRELERSLAERPFSIRFWDGTGVESTSGDGPVFLLAETFRLPLPERNARSR